MIYTYSLLSDFPNNKINLGYFIEELNINYIPVSNLSVQGDTVKLNTLLDLTTEQLNDIDTIISNHTGEEKVKVITEKVKIIEENEESGTQGHFQSRVIDLFISGVTGTTYKDITFPYPVSLFSAEWLVGDNQIGDCAEFHLSPDTICGVVTSNCNTGDTIINVNDTVFTQANISVGYHIKINNQDLGRVISKDENNLTITVENPIEENITSMTPILFTIKLVPHWRFTAPGFCSVGESKIGASLIPENTIMRMVYHNNNGSSKWFGISIDYLY